MKNISNAQLLNEEILDDISKKLKDFYDKYKLQNKELSIKEKQENEKSCVS